MFCSHCGKTLKKDVTACPHCGVEIGDSRFEGTGYTSVQARAVPGQEKKSEERYAPYTRTTYMTDGEANDGDVYARTTYRPVLAREEVPEQAQTDDVQPDQPKGDLVAAIDNVAELDPKMDDVVRGEGVKKSLRPVSVAGISPEVEEYMQRLNAQKSKPKRDLLKLIGIKREDDEQTPQQKTPIAESSEAGLRVTPLDENSEELDEAPAPRKGLKRTIGMAIGAVAIIAILIGGYMFISSLVAPRAKVDGVTYELYTQGLKVITENASEEYNRSIRQLHVSDYNDVAPKYAADRAAIEALMPANPMKNDRLFVDALLAVQTLIEFSANVDGFAALSAQSADVTSADSAAYRSEVTNALTKLTQADDVLILQGIVQDAKTPASIVIPTPEPEAAPTAQIYKTLTNGDKNSAAVQKMQQRLYELKYFNGDRDGDFGTVTQTAVKAFQQVVGMEVDGIATPEFQQRLFQADAPVNPNVSTTGGGETPQGIQPQNPAGS